MMRRHQIMKAISEGLNRPDLSWVEIEAAADAVIAADPDIDLGSQLEALCEKIGSGEAVSARACVGALRCMARLLVQARSEAVSKQKHHD